MSKQVLIAGGGIGGLAAGLAAVLAGCEVRLYERAAMFSEVGAGVQLSPNVVRQMQAWGLLEPLLAVACVPQRLAVRSALTGRTLASMALGVAMQRRYGAPYVTVHRADLHAVLLQAVAQRPQVHLNLGASVQRYQQEGQGAITLQVARQGMPPFVVEGDALIGADGLHSPVRQQLLGAAPARSLGHLAYRAVVPLAAIPGLLKQHSATMAGDAHIDLTQVTAWLGPQLHVVHYPVRRGELLNIVAICHGSPPADLQNWNQLDNAPQLEAVMAQTHAPLRALIQAVPQSGSNWRLWPLSDRQPVASADDMAQGLVALLGDAAHPMHPYLAQGAGMAIEDAGALQQCLAMQDMELALRLRRYALSRWQRNAQVQTRAWRNAQIFHATGPLRWGRDLAMRVLGARLLDQPWLYGATVAGEVWPVGAAVNALHR